MTEPVLRLRSDKYWEAVHEGRALQKIIDEQKAQLAYKERLLAEQDSLLAEQDNLLTDKDSLLAEYKRIYGELNPSQIKK